VGNPAPPSRASDFQEAPVPLLLKELLFAAGTMGLSLFFVIQSYKLPESAARLPRLLGSLILILSVIMIIQGFLAHQRMVKAGQKEEIPVINLKLVYLFLFFIVLYVAGIDFLGYFVATPLFIMGTYIYLKALSLKGILIVTAGFCALVYGLFVKVLHLPVPMGLLENLLGS
jgi:hypothetical protein